MLLVWDGTVDKTNCLSVIVFRSLLRRHLPTVIGVVKTCIKDADPTVRVAARKLFWTMHARPTCEMMMKNVMSSLDTGTQKHMQAELNNPTNGDLEELLRIASSDLSEFQMNDRVVSNIQDNGEEYQADEEFGDAIDNRVEAEQAIIGSGMSHHLTYEGEDGHVVWNGADESMDENDIVKDLEVKTTSVRRTSLSANDPDDSDISDVEDAVNAHKKTYEPHNFVGGGVNHIYSSESYIDYRDERDIDFETDDHRQSSEILKRRQSNGSYSASELSARLLGASARRPLVSSFDPPTTSEGMIFDQIDLNTESLSASSHLNSRRVSTSHGPVMTASAKTPSRVGMGGGARRLSVASSSSRGMIQNLNSNDDTAPNTIDSQLSFISKSLRSKT